MLAYVVTVLREICLDVAWHIPCHLAILGDKNITNCVFDHLVILELLAIFHIEAQHEKRGFDTIQVIKSNITDHLQEISKGMFK